VTPCSRAQLAPAAALALLALAACSGDAAVLDPSSPPTIQALKVLGCDTGLRVEFGAPLDPASVTGQSFAVEKVTGVTTWDPAERAATFRPETPFVSGDSYTAVLGTDLRTSAGVALSLAVRWQFACVDHTPPVVVGRVPLGDGVATLVQPVVRFSEPMDPASLTPGAIRIDGVDANPVVDANRRDVSLVPRRPLYPARTYTVTVSPSVRDANGNALGTEVSWSFRTRAPVDDWAVRPVTPALPDAAACDTAVELRLSPDFDLDVAALSDAPVAIDGAPDLTVAFDAANRLLRLTPHIPLRPGVSYPVIATAALRDRAGDHPYDTGSTILTLAVLPSCDEPTITSVPDAGAEIACDSPTSVRFSVPMDPATTPAAVRLADLTAGGYDPAQAPPVAATVVLSEDRLAAVVAPAAALVDGHRYLLVVAATARSADGRPLHAGGSFEFGAHCRAR
jgi:hypothetical protein